ncbi:MAG TPA: AAA family ATPase, partial [Bacteroidales bacterium]|nr:AAA family ATPase [Bacteroidales bacterium]
MNKIQTREDLLRHINQKESELKEVASKLKQDFVGLDNVINDLISSIKIWYIFPELQLRPTIVCLWGLTGVGKTDMVRKLVSYLKIQDRFLEIEMTSSGEGHRTIQHRLEESSISSSDQCILLLDEFQKFRTIDEDGTATQNSAYSDVWTLLSDGKFSSNLTKKTELLDQMLSNKYYKDWSEFENSQQEDSNDDDVDITETMENGKPVSAAQSKKKVNPAKPIERIYYTPVYLARRIKRLFRLEEDIETIMRWKDQDIYNLYDTCLNNTKLYEGEEYKKMLIIVSGNLDEAYHMAFEVSEADADADFYHGLSKKITVIDIKDALLKRFRPEQIARFGNSHILYPSLSRKDFMEIIVRKCKNITDLIKTQKDISFNLDKSVYEVIYNNGVFPTQGVRPLLSTITNILSVAIPTFIYKCLLANINVCDVFVEENKMYAYINNKKEFEIIPTI